MKLSIISDLSATSSYGLHTIQLARRLPKFGIDVVLRATKPVSGLPDDVAALVEHGDNDADVEMILKTPTLMPQSGKKTLYLTMAESTRLRPESVQMLNTADVVCVPSDWCATVFSANGVNKPIFTVPLGASEEFSYRPMSKPEPFTFACAGNLFNGHNRKGLQAIAECFSKAFQKNEHVRLLVKTSYERQLWVPGDDRILSSAKHLSVTELSNWLAQCHCFVNIATGGFELFPLEAARIGRPSIVFTFGGMGQYLNENNALVVSHRIVPAKDGWTGLGHWAEADEDSVIAAMRWAYHSFDYIERLGIDACKSTQHLTWDNHAQKLAEILKQMVAPSTAMADAREVLQILTPSKTAVGGDAYRKWLNRQWDEPGWYQQCGANNWPCGVFDFGTQSESVRFNPGLCQYNGSLYLFPRHSAFDVRTGARNRSRIECWKIADDMSLAPLGRIALLGAGEQEDARAIVRDGAIHLAYSQLNSRGVPEMRIAALQEDFRTTIVYAPQYGGNGNGKTPQKNWQPFIYDYDLYFVYDASLVIREVDKGFEEHRNGFDWSWWKWGRPRGGAPPIRINDGEYLSFFHSALPWMEEHHRLRYFTGAYCFQAKPPFRITRIVREPFLIGTPNTPDRIVPHSVVFVCGAVLDRGDLLVTAGVNDDISVHVRIPMQWMEENLRPV